MKKLLLFLFAATATAQPILRMYQEPAHILVQPGMVVSNVITLEAVFMPASPTNLTIDLKL